VVVANNDGGASTSLRWRYGQTVAWGSSWEWPLTRSPPVQQVALLRSLLIT